MHHTLSCVGIAGAALLIFNYERHARQFLADHFKKQRYPCDARSNLVRSSTEDTRPVTFRTCRRAPEPRDVLWGRASRKGTPVVLWRVLSWSMWLLSLAISFGLQWGMLSLSQRELEEKLARAQFGDDSDEVRGAGAHFCRDAWWWC